MLVNFVKVAHLDRALLSLLVSITLLKGLIFIALFPPWLAPDEPAHFEAIRIIGQLQLVPTLNVYNQLPMPSEMLEIFDNFHIWQESLRIPTITSENNPAPLPPFVHYYPKISGGSVVAAEGYPLLYHSLVSPISAMSYSRALTDQIYFLRFVALFLSIITIMIGWLFATEIFPDSKSYSVPVVTFMVFLPTYTHISTSINTDGPAAFTTSLFLLMLVNSIRKPSVLRWSAMVLVMLLAISVKPTTLFVVPTFVVGVLTIAYRKYKWHRLGFYLALLAIVVTIFIGAIMLFYITLAGRAVLSKVEFPPDFLDLIVLIPARHSWAIYLAAANYNFTSFWGVFGWANIHIPFVWIRVLAVITAFSIIGAGIFYWKCVFGHTRKENELSNFQKDVLLVLFFALLFSLIGVFAPIIADQSTNWGPPGRYLYPAILPIALLMYIGFTQLIPARLRRFSLPIWVTVWVFFDMATILHVIIPVIYG